MGLNRYCPRVRYRPWVVMEFQPKLRGRHKDEKDYLSVVGEISLLVSILLGVGVIELTGDDRDKGV